MRQKLNRRRKQIRPPIDIEGKTPKGDNNSIKKRDDETVIKITNGETQKLTQIRRKPAKSNVHPGAFSPVGDSSCGEKKKESLHEMWEDPEWKRRDLPREMKVQECLSCLKGRIGKWRGRDERCEAIKGGKSF